MGPCPNLQSVIIFFVLNQVLEGKLYVSHLIKTFPGKKCFFLLLVFFSSVSCQTQDTVLQLHRNLFAVSHIFFCFESSFRREIICVPFNQNFSRKKMFFSVACFFSSVSCQTQDTVLQLHRNLSSRIPVRCSTCNCTLCSTCNCTLYSTSQVQYL